MPLIAPIIAALFTLPVILWNSQHHWVTLRHVAKQTGAADGEFAGLNPINFLLSQFAVIGPTLIVLMIASIIYCLCRRFSQTDPNRDKLILLAWIGLPFLVFNLLASIRAKVQGNWPAPAYFSLTILTAYFLSTRLRTIEKWKPWRGWFYASLMIGVLIIPLAHDSSIILPIVQPIVSRLNQPQIARGKPPKYNLSEFDFLERLRGWHSSVMKFLCNFNLSSPALLLFAMIINRQRRWRFMSRGNRKLIVPARILENVFRSTTCGPIGALTQPRRSLDAMRFMSGRAVQMPHRSRRTRLLASSGFRLLPIFVRGVEIKTFKIWRCTGFLGMAPPRDLPEY